MTVVSIHTQAPSLQFDGNTITLGDQRFDLDEVKDFRVDVEGGLLRGYAVRYVLTDVSGERHLLDVDREDARANRPTVQTIHEAIKANREVLALAGAIPGTIKAGGKVFRAERRQDGSVWYFRREGAEPKRLFTRSFIADDDPEARSL